MIRAAYQASSEAAAALPVPEIDALDDRSWFADHPGRRFRACPGNGGIWLIRRRGGDPDVFLRSFSATRHLPEDDDASLAPAWYATAYPDWPAEKVRKWGRKALKKARRP